MGTVSIQIEGMRTLVTSAEKAITAVPEDQWTVRNNLTRVMLSGSSVDPADRVVGWLQGEIVGLRRRLAMAIKIEASTPGVQSFVQFDESSISTKTPAQAKALADKVAQNIRDGGGEIDPEILKILSENSADPYFASALAKQLSPEQIGQFVQNTGSRREYLSMYNASTDPQKIKDFDRDYAALLNGLGTALGIATQQTGPDLKLPADYTQKWTEAMVGDKKRPGQASWLALVVGRGTWSKEFTVGVTKAVYDYERKIDLPGTWQRDSYPGGSGYIGAVEPGGGRAYDPLASLLKAVGRNQDAALELFAKGPTTKIEVDGKQVEVNGMLKYLISERRWPTDKGQAAQEAIAAGMTPRLGGSTDSIQVAQDASALIKFKVAEIEARAGEDKGWFSNIGHLVLDGLGLIPVIGEPIDAINGIWYYAEGNVIDGSLSMAAVIPGVGWAATGGKWTRKGANAVEAGSKLLTRDGKVFDETAESFKLLAKGDNVEPGVFKFKSMEDLNRAANNPHPGVTYQYKDMSWTTDELGRTTYVQGKLTKESAGRDPKLQRDIGKGPDAKDSDVGFHLIADSLGGPTNKLNVLPGNGKPIDDGLANLNQGAYASMEKALRKALGEGKDVDIELTPVYRSGNSTTRPDEFHVTTWVDGVDVDYVFVNK
jgi:hypothetical protein